MSIFNKAQSMLNDTSVLTNIADNIKPIQKTIKGGAYILGLAFAFKALYSLKVYGESRTMMSQQNSIKEPMMYLFVAAVLLVFPTALGMMLNTTFGASEVTAYTALNSSNATIAALSSQSLVIIIQTIGYIAFVRGWVLVARASSQGNQPGTTGKGLIHVFGGILAINIVSTLQIVNNTLYGT